MEAIHSPKYKKVKDYYLAGLWSEARVFNAAVKRWVTGAEYWEITGKAYTGV